MSRFVSLLSVLLFTVLFYVYSVLAAQIPSPYIYRIKVSQCDHYPYSRQLTGFRLQGKQGIVTALHGVVDCDSITAVNEAPNGQNFVDLELRSVDIERDVALLSSDKLDRLSAYEGLYPASTLDNVDNQYFSVVGYPVGLSSQNLSKQALIVGRKKLKDLIPSSYRRELNTRNSPDLSISVLQIQIHLLPGHSGAPVFDSVDQVVGIGNGGLEGGTAEIGWLIPITDIEWQSVLNVEYELDQTRRHDQRLALYFSSTYLGRSPSSTVASTPTSTPTRSYGPAPYSSPDKNCDCSRNLYDCPDFATQDDAQKCYWSCGAKSKGDIHRLDLDRDQQACEEYFQVYQSRVQATPIPTSTPRPTYTPLPTYTLIPTYTPALRSTSTPTPMPRAVQSTSRASLGIGSTYLNSFDGATYVYVPAGDFIMGSTEAGITQAVQLCKGCPRSQFAEERPQKVVYLTAFWIMKTEVTNAQYRRFIDDGGYQTREYWSAEGWNWKGTRTQPHYWHDSRYNGDQQPIVGVRWFEAEAYTRWLSARTGLDFRLPTEAEWEKAARGTDGRTFPWGSYWDGYRVNYCDSNCGQSWADGYINDGYAHTAPVGSYPSGVSPYGALDMSGNVWEWTSDWYRDNYNQLAYYNPTGPLSGEKRVVRGGSIDNGPDDLRTTSRYAYTPVREDFTLGFRLRLAPSPNIP